MTVLGFKEFAGLYREELQQVWARWTPEMQSGIARHCRAWSPGRFDFRGYLEASVRRYHIAYRAFAGEPLRTVCDVGGFWGIFPATLARIGYQVTITESLRYYGDSFNALFDHLRARGVRVVDYDPFSPSPPPLTAELVTVMAVLEHYPHSLRRFMSHITAMMAPEGRLYLEVPNIAYWPKRIDMLLGRSPLASLEEVYESAEPYLGHHREFTRADLRRLAELAGLAVLSERSYTYSLAGGVARRLLLRPLQTLALAVAPDTREVLSALCSRSGAPGRGRA